MQKHIVFGAVALCALAANVNAGLIASDSYVTGSDPTAGQYVVGALKTSQPTLKTQGFVDGAYSQGSGTSNFTVIASGSSYGALNVSGSTSGRVQWLAGAADNTIRSVARNLSPVATSNTFWASYLVSRTALNTTGTNGFVLTGFGNAGWPGLDSPTGANATNYGSLSGLLVGFAQHGASGTQADLVIRYRSAMNGTTGVNSDAVLVDGSVGVGTSSVQYMVLAKIDVNAGPAGTDAVTWWLNPINGSDESTLAQTALATGSFNAYEVAQLADPKGDFARLNYTSNNWPGNAFFDEPRLSTDLAGIGLAVPEPTGLAMIGAAAIGLIARRRRA